MIGRSELETAIAFVLAGAVCLGFVLHWLWQVLRGAKSDSARLGEMAERLHAADLSREAAESACHDAEATLARREAEIAEQLAVMQSRLDGAIEGREAELTRELAETQTELEAMRDGLGNARRRILDLEAEIEALRGAE